MRILYFSTLLCFCLSAFAELKYQSFTPLDDQESADVRILSDHKSRLQLTPPKNDYLILEPVAQKLFNDCKELHTMLVFTQDIQSLIKSCDIAYNAGAADAAYLIGESLMSAQWTAPDYTTAYKYLEKAASNGSRSAQRYLISAYKNPRLPINNSHRAYELAKELAQAGEEWDVLTYSMIQTTGKNKEEAVQGYQALLGLAQKGYQNVYNLLALIKIVNGPLQDLDYAENLLNRPYKKEFSEMPFTKVMFAIMKNDFVAAREQLADCYLLNSPCAMTYIQFLSLGIAGDKDLERAVEVLDYALMRSSSEFANDYAWVRSTAKEKPLFDPIAAQKAINNIPEYKKAMPFIIDTVAANYAAKGNYAKAIQLQEQILRDLKGKGLGVIYEGMQTRLEGYKNNERWHSQDNTNSYINKLKSIQNLSHMDSEIASL